jgi:biopolymer transport protein ExbD
MGVSIDTSKRKTFNVDLNIVPFIDLMSCLTAFLLVTAAWVNIASVDVKPRGKTRDMPERECDTADCIYLSVLVEPDAIWIGQSRTNELDKIPNTSTGPDYQRLGERLKDIKKQPQWSDKDQIEIAVNSTAAHPISYQVMVAAMDTAVASGFRDVGITDPDGLATRPQI